MSLDIPNFGVAQFIKDLAARHNVAYITTYGDKWAQDISRMLGDDVETDEIEYLIIALKRAKVITGREMGELLNKYLDENRGK